MKKGVAGIEFVVAITIFLIAFWFIYVQSMAMLTPKTQSTDPRIEISDYVSWKFVSEPGKPVTWTTNPTKFGLTYYLMQNNENVLDKRKLDYSNGRDCDTLSFEEIKGLKTAFAVQTPKQEWSCEASFPKQSFVQRSVYVFDPNTGYEPGVLKVWVA